MGRVGSIRYYTIMLGLRANDRNNPQGTARLKFDDGVSEMSEVVQSLWTKTLHARTGGPPWNQQQRFGVVEDIVRVMGPKIWRQQSRHHLLNVTQKLEALGQLLNPGETAETMRPNVESPSKEDLEIFHQDLCWGEDHEIILGIFLKIYNATPIKTQSCKNRKVKPQACTASEPFKFSFEISDDDLDYDEYTQARSPSPDENAPVDMFKTHIRAMDISGTYHTMITLGKMDSIPVLFQAIREAFYQDYPDKMPMIEAKGEIFRIKILVWNLGIREPVILDVESPQAKLLNFRDNVAMGYIRHRDQRSGERVLCLTTVLFENDVEEEQVW